MSPAVAVGTRTTCRFCGDEIVLNAGCWLSMSKLNRFFGKPLLCIGAPELIHRPDYLT
jgi:hypothetical protein